MNATDIRAAAVLGAGQMGGGIAHVCAQAGLATTLYDNNAAALAAAPARIAAAMARQVKKQQLTEAEAAAALARLRAQPALGDWLGDADVVIEAASEDYAIKRDLLASAAPRLHARAILASNTSSYSITQLAAHTPCADRFIGLHFMNPAHQMPLLEIIAGERTSAATLRRAQALAQQLGKQTVQAADLPGFIANRILLPMLNEAMHALQDGAGGVADIDRAMTLGMRHPMGPLMLADFIGLDVCLAILNTLHDGFQEAKYRPCPLLKQLVTAGHLGKKTARGFYDHSSTPPIPNPRLPRPASAGGAN